MIDQIGHADQMLQTDQIDHTDQIYHIVHTDQIGQIDQTDQIDQIDHDLDNLHPNLPLRHVVQGLHSTDHAHHTVPPGNIEIQ